MGEWVNSSELLRLSFKKKMSKSSLVWPLCAMPLKGAIPRLLPSYVTCPVIIQKQFIATLRGQSKYFKVIPFGALTISIRKLSTVPSPRIWFHLYGSDGMPYNGVSVSSVRLPPDSVIDEFRDAVKAKNSNKLAAVDAADLIVFENKAAFDMKVRKISLIKGSAAKGIEANRKFRNNGRRGTYCHCERYILD